MNVTHMSPAKLNNALARLDPFQRTRPIYHNHRHIGWTIVNQGIALPTTLVIVEED